MVKFETELAASWKKYLRGFSVVWVILTMVAMAAVVVWTYKAHGALTWSILTPVSTAGYVAYKFTHALDVRYRTARKRIASLVWKLDTDGTHSIAEAMESEIKTRRVVYHYTMLLEKVKDYARGVDVDWNL